MTFDPKSVRETREGLLLRLLFRTTDAMNRTMADRIRARGYRDFQPSFTGVLAHIDTEGTRVGTLASRMGVTRQAASQRLQEIEALGYLERVRDPNDGRAVVARHTPAGRRILLTAIDVMLRIEDEYEKVLGREGLVTLKQLLTQLAEQTDASGALESK
jgi:DNA-binding MarR family transcriptional regulator